jgi:putative transposase
MVNPSTKRRAVKLSVERGLGRAASACRALGLARSSFYRSGRESLEKCRVRKEVVELSARHPRYGYRRITALLRREGFEVNAKRVARIRREEGFKVSKRQRRMRRLGLSTAERQRAQRARQVWSWDFVEDQGSIRSFVFRAGLLFFVWLRFRPGAVAPSSSPRAAGLWGRIAPISKGVSLIC